MRAVSFFWVSAAAAALIALGAERASAQTYYVYASQQAAPSGQATYPCQPCQACHGCVTPPPPPCQPEKCGCEVVYCPPTTCQPSPSCVPDIPFYPPPGCVAACVIKDECAPELPAKWVTIYRNHYVPIRIEKTQSQHQVQPVNIQVRERIVHYLCDCAPGTTNCPHVPTGTPQTSASPPSGSGQATAAAQPETNPASPVKLTGQVTPAQSPPDPAADATKKGWIWLTNENCYGYGYIDANGLAIVDPATKTTNPAIASAN
jgi:hypothetical protein